MTAPAGEPLLVYDGDCGFCQRSIDVGRRWPHTVPYQRLDLAAAGLSAEQVRTAAWWIHPDGRAESGRPLSCRRSAMPGRIRAVGDLDELLTTSTGYA